jgi:hypothetical protein
MGKKVGIITFHSSHNCGSMLQAYAIQTILAERYGAEVEIINFANSGSRNVYSLFDLRLKKSSIKKNFNTVRNLSVIKDYRKDYMEFAEQYLHTTSKEYKITEALIGIEKNYDMLIAGGDQVWNVLCDDADPAYFLSFAKGVKKIAYAPSLGGNNINIAAKNPNDYRKYLVDFDMLSVREPNGKIWLEELTGREVPIIADPTLLLTKEEWCSRFELPEIKGDFIFNYAFFHNRPEANSAIQKISEETRLPVYILDTKSWAYYKLDKYGIRRTEHAGPITFIAMMNQANMVLTQSFHGTLFSALFHKQFWSYRAPATKRIDDDRATAILDQLGLRDRYQLIDELPDKNYRAKIDYSDTDDKIATLRERAFDYINSFML